MVERVERPAADARASDEEARQVSARDAELGAGVVERAHAARERRANGRALVVVAAVGLHADGLQRVFRRDGAEEERRRRGERRVDEHTAQITNARGTVGLANMGRKDTGSSQLFVNLRDNPDTDWWKGGAAQCVVVGKVTAGLDVVEAIGRAKTAGKLFGDRPLQPLRITRAIMR